MRRTIVLAAVFLTLFAIGMQCDVLDQDAGHSSGGRQRQRPLRNKGGRANRKLKRLRVGAVLGQQSGGGGGGRRRRLTTTPSPTEQITSTLAVTTDHMDITERVRHRGHNNNDHHGRRGSRPSEVTQHHGRTVTNTQNIEGNVTFQTSLEPVSASSSSSHELDHNNTQYNSTLSHTSASAVAGNSSLEEEADTNSTMEQGENNNVTTPVPTRTMEKKREMWSIKQRSKQARIAQIQHEILRKLGLRTQPNITISPESARHIRLIYNNMAQGRVQATRSSRTPDDYYARKYKSYIPSCELPRNCDDTWIDESRYRLYFKVQEPIGNDASLASATLKLYKMAPQDNQEVQGETSGSGRNRRRTRAGRVRQDSSEMTTREDEDDTTREPTRWQIKIFQYKKPVRKTLKVKKKLILTNSVEASYEGWVELNLTNAVSNWRRLPNKNFGFYVKVTAMENKRMINIDPFEVFKTFNCSTQSNQTLVPLPFPLSVADAQNDSDVISNQTYPRLDVVITGQPERRKRRDADRDTNSLSCSMEKMYISFEELGWDDWIIEPTGFETGFCTPNTQDNENNNENDNECCQPVKSKPLNVIHIQEGREGTLMRSQLENMIVTDCACEL